MWSEDRLSCSPVCHEERSARLGEAKEMSGDVGEVLVLKGLRVGVWGLLRIM